MTFEDVVAAAARYSVVLEPDEDTPEWWAGAPSVVRGRDGSFTLAARMREGRSPRGRRGYEIRILRSSDGKRFETVNRLRREDARLPVFERPAIAQDPATGRYRLWGCAELGHGWGIVAFDDADDPAGFDARTARPVLEAPVGDEGFARILGYKDPFVFRDGGIWRMLVIGYDKVERPYQFESADGLEWRQVGGRLLESTGWHDFFTRPACAVPLAVGWLLVYEGSSIDWLDPAYNIATGLAYSPDLRRFVDLTPEAPLLRSTTPGRYHTWRYSHWLPVGDELYVYFEAARPNGTNELRVAVLDPLGDLAARATPPGTPGS